MSRRVEIFEQMRDRNHRETDRMFAKLLVAQWLFAVALALLISPWTYAGSERALHLHVKAALVFGALINALPLALIYLRPGWWGTRQTIAVVQMLWSALLIMITGGRIETHFHVFGSLAFLAFYRDWKLLPTATIVVAVDHLARGLWWPDSVYGTLDPEWWRFLEHAGWVAFEDIVLAYACVRGVRELRELAAREASLEDVQAATEQQVVDRTLELQRSMERYRALVENTSAIPFEIDRATLKLRYIAPQAATLFECTLEELGTENFLTNLLHPEDTAKVARALTTYASSEHGVADSFDYRVMLRSGRTLFLRTLLSSRDGDRVYGIAFDTTRQRQLELELQQAQKLESVGRLAAGVAHEINTPVQFVNDSVEFVREAVTDVFERHAADIDPYLLAEVPQALDRAVDGLQRVAVIVRSMKVFAHANAECSDVDLNDAVESTLTIARNEIKYCADVETDFGALPQVRCHGGEINQVLLNLLLNAAHAVGDVVKTSGARGKITIRTRRDGDDAVISIADTGTGIPDGVRDRVFDPFFTTKPVGKGTGQGLAIARSVIVDKHHGSLTFDSELGAGTTFHLRIPIGHGASDGQTANLVC
jgi:PAS domain S-box-containing protein